MLRSNLITSDWHRGKCQEYFYCASKKRLYYIGYVVLKAIKMRNESDRLSNENSIAVIYDRCNNSNE